MNALNTLEHMLDGMGIDYNGSLERVPERERHEGEYCYQDGDGIIYRVEGLELSIEPPDGYCPPEAEQAPDLDSLVWELKPYEEKRKRGAKEAPFAVNRMNGLWVDPKRQSRIFAAARSDTLPEWLRKLTFRTLRSEEEYALFAVRCNAYNRMPYVRQAIEKLRDKSLLFTVAVAAGRSDAREAAIQRFSEDESFLRAVQAWIREKEPDSTVTKALVSDLLKPIEERRSRAMSEDELTKGILSGEITETTEQALERIKGEENLLKLMLADLDLPVLRNVVRRAAAIDQSEAFKGRCRKMILKERLKGCETILFPLLRNEDLVNVLTTVKTDGLLLEADDQLYQRYRRAEESGQPLPPLIDEQQDALLAGFEGLTTLRSFQVIRLLDPDRQHKLFVYRLKNGLDTSTTLRYAIKEKLTDEELLLMRHARDRDTRMTGDVFIRCLPAERLGKLAVGQNSLPLLGVAYDELKQRGEDAAEVIACADGLVLPMIEAAKTARGYDGNKIVELYNKLSPGLAAHYGFTGEEKESETQDGDIWQREYVNFAGERYLVYSSM